MLCLSPVTALQCGIAALMTVSAVISLAEPQQAPSKRRSGQDEIAAPADDEAMQKFMARKLAAAQKALEAVAKDDFDQVRKSTAEMIELSRHEAWERMASPRFVQDTVDFVSAAEFLSRMAEAKDAEGTSLGFMRLTMTCTNCHQHVRTSSVAHLDPDVAPEDRTLIAEAK
ncbi:MAG: cytochrome c [Planctomycetaceae bacterium]|nr:cytochrome c [Planctomycetaceae bacterium]